MALDIVVARLEQTTIQIYGTYCFCGSYAGGNSIYPRVVSISFNEAKTGHAAVMELVETIDSAYNLGWAFGAVEENIRKMIGADYLFSRRIPGHFIAAWKKENFRKENPVELDEIEFEQFLLGRRGVLERHNPLNINPRDSEYRLLSPPFLEGECIVYRPDFKARS